MPVKLSSLKSNLHNHPDEGEWVPAPGLPGVRFKVRPIDGPGAESYRIKRDQLLKTFERNYAGNPPPAEDAAEWGRLIHDEILRGWDGIDEAYSPEAALAALSDEEHRELRSQVLICASRLTSANIEFVEAAAKNSAAPSAST
jgi:hypothetical protein